MLELGRPQSFGAESRDRAVPRHKFVESDHVSLTGFPDRKEPAGHCCNDLRLPTRHPSFTGLGCWQVRNAKRIAIRANHNANAASSGTCLHRLTSKSRGQISSIRKARRCSRSHRAEKIVYRRNRTQGGRPQRLRFPTSLISGNCDVAPANAEKAVKRNG
jgi:hypothetical protein